MPLQRSSKRSQSYKKPNEIPQEVINPRSRSPTKFTTTANRLIQKRRSVERKIEEMRKQKIEEEIKELQSKPKILSRSRVLANRAEKKSVVLRPQQEVKIYCDDETIELEEDIQMIEACLNMDKTKVVKVEYGSKFPVVHNNIDEYIHNGAVKASENVKKTQNFSKVKTPVKTSMNSVKKIAAESYAKNTNATPQRKFIKRKSSSIKQRSSSMGHLLETQFGYRPLSPFQITIKRKVENN